MAGYGNNERHSGVHRVSKNTTVEDTESWVLANGLQDRLSTQTES